MPFQKNHKLSCGKNNPFYGKKHSLETKKRMRQAKLNHSGNKWSLERKIKVSEKMKGNKLTERVKEKIRRTSKGNNYSPLTEFKKGHITWNKGKKTNLVPKTAFKKGHHSFWLGKKRPNLSQEKHHNWKGGISSLYSKIRQSQQYKNWRRDVFIRDSFTCQKCGHRFINIIAHHIKYFAKYKKLWFEVKNGQTLCRSCHLKLHQSTLRLF